MAHEIEILNGKASMMYVGEAPWHKLGTKLNCKPTIDQAITAAGLNWNVGLKPLFTAEGTPVDARATYRESDGAILGVVGEKYRPLQNDKAFDFFKPFLDAGEARLECAGSLREGKRVFVLAKINRAPSVIVARADDKIEKYVLLSNDHSGQLSVRVGFTPIRVVCSNTLSMALGSGASKLLRIRHSASVVANLEKVREVMNLANQEFETTAENYYRLLASREIRAKDVRRYIKVVFDLPDDEKKLSSRAKNIISTIEALTESGRGNNLPGVRGTWWAVYNGLNEYLGYVRGASDDKRLDSLWFGDGARVNRRALEIAATMASGSVITPVPIAAGGLAA